MASKIGRYDIIRELGRGSMGTVYEARDSQLNRTVALKVLTISAPDPGAKRQAIERFYREGKAAGSLLHPNIVQVYDVGEDQGRHYMVMELCEGTTLRDVLSFEHTIPESRLKLITEGLLSALELAHARGIVHRDIKPENIVIDRQNRVKLMDFGIAKVIGQETMTQTGQALGSPSYMSPEQVLGKPVDGRSDIFSLGVVLYECLTGCKPFSGVSISAVTHQIAFENPTPISNGQPFWSAFIMKALQKEPSQRYASASQMITVLETGNIPAPPVQPSGYQTSQSQNATLMGQVPPTAGMVNRTTVVMPPQMPPQYPGSIPAPPSYPPQPYYQGAYTVVAPHRSGTLITFGILGLCCCAPFGLAAWIMSHSDIAEMKCGRMDPSGLKQAESAQICGIIATAIWGILTLIALGK